MPKTEYFTEEMGKNVFVFQPPIGSGGKSIKNVYSPTIYNIQPNKHHRVNKRALNSR